jgi:DHA2 family multidrug resistance protein
MDTHLSPVDAGPQFIASQIFRGVAQFFSMLFLNQAATSSVAHDLVDDASGLFNAARNLGGSFGLAIIATLQDQRQTLHEARISEALNANSVIVQQNVQSQGLTQIHSAIVAQATVMTYADLYWVFGLILLALIPLVLVLKPLPKGAQVSMG